jgi:TolB protein
MRLLALITVTAAGSIALLAGTQEQPPAPPPQGPIRTIMPTSPGLPPKLAVPDFIPLSSDAETVAAAKTIGQVLWDDLNFEREFYMIPRDTYRTIPQPASLEQVSVDRWRTDLNADGVIVGTVRRSASGFVVQMRLLQTMTGQAVMAKEYTAGATTSPRFFAHTIADEVHQDQRGLRGVARTKLAFSSDRDGQRMKGPVGPRDISNIYIADYDGANQRRVTVTRSLDIAPAFAPDGRAIAFSSWRTGFQDIYVLFPYGDRALQNPTKGSADNQNYLPRWSHDGTKIAFTSSRDGNPEIYTMNRDGSGLRRLTNHPGNDVTPTWSPSGTQIAFTSDRTGSPQIWIVGTDGTGLRRISNESHADRPTWSAAPFNEIAYTARSSAAGFDISVFDFSSGTARRITDGIGSNESPAFAPNGRHIAFTSSRAGKYQIFTIARDGRDLRQITREGENRYPDWSQ